MSRSLPLTLGVLTLAACAENTTPTQPEVGEDPAPAAVSLAAAPNTWTARAAYPSVFGTVGLSAGVAPDAVGQSIVYSFGGTDRQGGSGVSIRTYNVATNTWTQKSYEPRVYVFNTNGVGKIGSKFYFSGGYTYGDGKSIMYATYAYDPAPNRLIRKADMPKATADGVTGVIDGKLYMLPGTCSGGDPYSCEQEPIRRLYRYDPATNTWVGRAAAPHFHKSGAGGVIDGKFYVAGGLDGSNGSQPVADLDVYDPATNSWKTLAPVPTAGRAIGAVLGGKLYVIVGSAGSELRTYAYNPGTNTWKAKASPTWPHDALVRVTLDGRTHLLAVGGIHGSDTIPNDSELYTP